MFTSIRFPEHLSLSAADIKKLLESGRSNEFECLPEVKNLAAVSETIAAMANSSGGLIVIGADSELETPFVGIKDALPVVDKILEASLKLDPPLIAPLPEIIDIDEHQIVVGVIPHGMPHVYEIEGRYLFRINASNQPLKPRELRQLFIERGEFSFETSVAPQTSLDDIDWAKVGEYARLLRGISDDPKALLLKRGCLVHYEGKPTPTNAGILLFGKDPQRFLLGSEIVAARFAGLTMGDNFVRQDITGTLPEQIRKAEAFLVDNLRKDVHLKDKMARQETYEYPMEAAREIVVNAVAHRDYSVQGDSIHLNLFRDRMEVINPGGLAGPITVDNIKDERFSRNPAIVQVLADMGFIERLGYGVDRVIELMAQQELQTPDFIETEAGFRVTLHNAPHNQSESVTDGTDDTILSGLSDLAINPRQEAAIIYLQQPENTRITNSELQRIFPDVHAETIRRDLADLVTKEILSKMGQKRGSYYVLRKDIKKSTD